MDANGSAAGVKGSVGILALLAVVVLAGCGLGPGEDRGSAALLVTRDYGREVLLEQDGLELNESTTALRLLDERADLETAYGGGFVQAVDGLEGGSESGRRSDWFYSVNGVVAERGSAEFPPADGDLVWWDYRDWTDAMEVGAVVGAYPAPLAGGYDGRDWSVRLECFAATAACDLARSRLEADGVELADGASAEVAEDGMRVLVGAWSRLRDRPEGRRIEAGPQTSGVFADFDEAGLTALDVTGEPAVRFGPEAGLVAAMRRGNRPPVWIVTGGSEAAVEAAAAALNREDLARRYAAVAAEGRIGSLPWPGSG